VSRGRGRSEGVITVTLDIAFQILRTNTNRISDMDGTNVPAAHQSIGIGKADVKHPGHITG
jgi:hypothetical protein